MSNNKRDFYEVLGIAKNATPNEIKKAFRKKAMQFHPDKNKNPDSEEKFKEVSEAYEILSDVEKRKIYDQFGHDGISNEGQNFGGGGFGGFEDIFSNFFSGFGGSNRSNSRSWGNANTKQTGSDFHSRIKVTFMESILGGTKDIKLQKWELCDKCLGNGSKGGHSLETCSSCEGHGIRVVIRRTMLGQIQQQEVCSPCHGKGKIITEKCAPCNGIGYKKHKKTMEVNIPAGIQNGQSIIVRGFGDKGVNGGLPGDLYIEIHCGSHRHYERDGDDLYLEVPISIFDAVNQSEVEIPTPYGPYKIKLKANIKSGEKIIIKNHGAKSLRRDKKGMLIAIINLYVPAKLSAKQSKTIYAIGQRVSDKTYQNFLKDF